MQPRWRFHQGLPGSTALVLGALIAISAVFPACRSKDTRPDGTPSPTIDFTLSLKAPGLNVTPPTGPIDIGKVTDGTLRSAAVLAKTETSARVRFTCTDGSEHEVDIPIGGGYVDTGCTSGGKKVRISIKP